jgi:L-fucono-1,5-lactonase
VSPVIDAHHHLLDPARFDYPWLTPGLSAIDRRFGPDDLVPELLAAGIDRTILVQTISSLEETRGFLETAVTVPFISGVIGWVDLTDRGVGDTLDTMRGGPGGEWLVGIRHQVHDEPDPDWLLRPDVRRGLAAIEAAGLAYDLLVRSRELPAALVVAREMPGLRFVIDHLAKPPIRTGASEPWVSLIRPFGELSNVWCKLSGLVTEADPTRWQVADLAPHTEIALETFGPQRLLFGSDWPVCLLAASYADVVGAARELTTGLSIAERAAVFGGASEAAYGLSVATDRIG